MEPHTDEKGGLKGKFEDFSYTPKEEVWDRIAAGPGERPLGALFATFAWIPNARVWKRISAELHPVPVLRIASWSVAAAAAIALLVWLQFGGAGAGENAGNGLVMSDPATGKHLANREMQGCWTERPAFANGNEISGSQGNSAHDQARDKAGSNDLAGSNPTSVKDMHPSKSLQHQPVPKNEMSFASEGSGLRIVHDWPEEKRQDWPSELIPKTFAALDVPFALHDINRRTTQIAALDAERAKMAQAERDAALRDWNNEQRRAEPAALMAQAGASLSGTGSQTGNMEAFPMLPQFTSLDNNTGLAAHSESRQVSDEKFSTPLVLGAQLDRRLVGGLGLGGGLVYTRMQSYLDGALGYTSQHLDITRQYLGLGLNLTYNLNLSKRNNRLGLFGIAGTQYDFGLAKHQVLTTRQGEVVVDRLVDDSKLGGQASFNAGLGLRYTLYKNIGLYAQANAAHYFYAAEANLYTGRLAWPSLQVGLRVRL